MEDEALVDIAAELFRERDAREASVRSEMRFTVEIDREADGRWIAEILEVPGALAYGQTKQEAIERAQSLCFGVLADRIEHGDHVPELGDDFSSVS